MRLLMLAAAAAAVCAVPAAAQTTGVVPLGQLRTADGRVEHPGPKGTAVPLAGVFVVLHRVGTKSAGPLDSVRTDAHGAYHFRYRTRGEPDAVYFASTRYAGIAYFTAPFQAPDVSSPDADIMVFDTTSTGIHLELAGRHVVVGAPGPNGARPVAEVFDLENDSSKTLIARDTLTPLWTAPLPPGATAPEVNGGDIAPEAVTFRGNQVALFAPISPGIRQLAIDFQEPPSAFPLAIRMDRPTPVLEVMLEEADARPVLAGLQQQASVSAQGASFTRYLAQNLPAGAVLRIDVRAVSDATRTRFISGVALAVVAIMGAALVLALRRRPRAAPAGAAPTAVPPVLLGATPAEQLRFELANLDAAHARGGVPDAAATARYRASRAELETRLAQALAEQERAP